MALAARTEAQKAELDAARQAAAAEREAALAELEQVKPLLLILPWRLPSPHPPLASSPHPPIASSLSPPPFAPEQWKAVAREQLSAERESLLREMEAVRPWTFHGPLMDLPRPSTTFHGLPWPPMDLPLTIHDLP